MSEIIFFKMNKNRKYIFFCYTRRESKYAITNITLGKRSKQKFISDILFSILFSKKVTPKRIFLHSYLCEFLEHSFQNNK